MGKAGKSAASGRRFQPVKKPRRVSRRARREIKSNRFSGGVYVGKTLCAERASQGPSGAEAQAQRNPFGGKGVSLFRQPQAPPPGGAFSEGGKCPGITGACSGPLYHPPAPRRGASGGWRRAPRGPRGR